MIILKARIMFPYIYIFKNLLIDSSELNGLQKSINKGRMKKISVLSTKETPELIFCVHKRDTKLKIKGNDKTNV